MMSTKIKLLREQCGWTQAELARRLVTTRSSVNAWESGISMPSTQYIIELSRIFHVSTDYLFGLNQHQTLDVTGLSPDQVATLTHLVDYLRQSKDAG
jgi:transcriptional regulator with XRE-family HTH domain